MKLDTLIFGGIRYQGVYVVWTYISF